MGLFHTKNVDHMICVGHSDTGLKKALGPLDLTLLGAGAIVGTDIFILIGVGVLTMESALTLSSIVAALTRGFTALCYAKSASTISMSGSIYTYAYATMGELVTRIIGWDLMLEYSLATPAVSVGWSGYFRPLFPSFGLHPPVVPTAAPGAIPGTWTLFNLPVLAVMLLIATLLSFGIHEPARANSTIVAIKMTVVPLFIAVGACHVQPANWQPFMPFGMEGVSDAAATVFFASIGFDAVTSAAEEVRNPKRDLPVGIIGPLVVRMILYMVVAVTMTGIALSAKFVGVDRPVSLAFQAAGENWVAGFADPGAIIGMMTVILVMTYGQAHIIFAISHDGLLPKHLSYVYPCYPTPFLSTRVVGIVFALIAVFVPLNVLVELINIGALAVFLLVAMTVLIPCWTRPDLYRGSRCSGMPVVPLLAVSLCLFPMSQLQAVTWTAFVVWVLIGLMVYFGYARRRSLPHGSEPGPALVFEAVY